jgi:hypothetical protein
MRDCERLAADRDAALGKDEMERAISSPPLV